MWAGQGVTFLPASLRTKGTMRNTSLSQPSCRPPHEGAFWRTLDGQSRAVMSVSTKCAAHTWCSLECTPLSLGCPVPYNKWWLGALVHACNASYFGG